MPRACQRFGAKEDVLALCLSSERDYRRMLDEIHVSGFAPFADGLVQPVLQIQHFAIRLRPEIEKPRFWVTLCLGVRPASSAWAWD